MSKTPYDAVLHAGRGFGQVSTALAAEMLGATLLGSVYAVASGERADAVREFVGDFLAHTARRRTVAARAARTVFASLVPGAPGAGRVRPPADPPPWVAQLGKVQPRGSWAYGDVYGDQTSYLASFGYEDPQAGGAEHALVVLIDHNIGIVKDVFVGEPADRLLAAVSEAAGSDDLVWLSEVAPARLREQVESHLQITDQLSTLPDGGSLATDRMLVESRLAALPAPEPGTPAPVPEPAALLEAFLASGPAQQLVRGADNAEDTVRYAVGLILDFCRDAPDDDPLRWSPAVAGLFLLDWVHRRAVLDDDDVAAVPPVVRAWAAWAAQQRRLPAAAAAATDEAIDAMVPEFRRLHHSGERRDSPPSAIPRPR